MWGVIKRDLAEFVTVVKADTTEVVKKTITDKEQEAEAAAERRALQKEKAPLRALVSDLKTYTEDVSPGDKAAYDSFARSFDVASKTETISQLLADDPVLTKIHAELVPGQVAYAVFWQRYFFRTARAMTSSLNLAGADDSEEEDLGWDEDEDEDDKVEMSGSRDGSGGGNSSAEAGAAKSVPPVPSSLDHSPQMDQKLEELQSQNRKLQEELSTAQVEVSRLSSVLEDSSAKKGEIDFASQVASAVADAEACLKASLTAQHEARLQEVVATTVAAAKEELGQSYETQLAEERSKCSALLESSASLAEELESVRASLIKERATAAATHSNLQQRIDQLLHAARSKNGLGGSGDAPSFNTTRTEDAADQEGESGASMVKVEEVEDKAPLKQSAGALTPSVDDSSANQIVRNPTSHANDSGTLAGDGGDSDESGEDWGDDWT